MSNRKRIKRPQDELVSELRDQVALLVHACESFDRGLSPIGKHIALSLRVLLHQHGTSRALLEQLGLRSKRYLDTAGDINPKNLLTDVPLCAMRVGNGSAEYVPTCRVGSPVPPRWIPFERWWNNNVIKDNVGRYFNRRELILHVANTDGGAHVDPDLDEAYMDLSRNNSLGWTFGRAGQEMPLPAPTLPCIRQIAHEVLETLKRNAGGTMDVGYEVERV